MRIVQEEIKNNAVECDNCGWSWKLSEGGDDKYVCHKCGHDNTPKKSNFDIIFDEFSKKFPVEYVENVNIIKNYVSKYLKDSGVVVKYLKFCSRYRGVRTKDQVIICSPQQMDSLGDFLYTLFHEMRHEQQIDKIKMDNPLTDYDLEDFEKIYKQYWEMELDADQYAKNMVGKLVYMSNLPIDVAKSQLSLSKYIENYPSYSKMIESSLKNIIETIKEMKKRGQEYTDVQDLDFIKKDLELLQDLF